MGRRSNGEGSISKRKDGRWVAQYTIEGKRKYIYGRTRKEVAEKLTKALSEINRGFNYDSEIEVGDYLQGWLHDSVRDSVRLNTWERYEQICRMHLIPEIGNIKLHKLSPMVVQDLYRRKLDSGLSPRTVQYIHVTLHKALKQALRWRLVESNVSEAVTPVRVQRREIKPLTPEQTKTFLRNVAGDTLEALYVLAITAGLRQGELLGLKWEDIEFQDRVVRVRRSLSLTREGYVLTEPKSPKSRRSIRLTADTIAALENHKVMQDKSKSGSWKDHGLVFPNQSGEPMHTWILLKDSFWKVLQRSGLPRIRFHDLRHTCATLLLTKGVHPKLVQELLGHSSISITLDTYSHVLPNMQEKVMEAMEDTFE